MRTHSKTLRQLANKFVVATAAMSFLTPSLSNAVPCDLFFNLDKTKSDSSQSEELQGQDAETRALNKAMLAISNNVEIAPLLRDNPYFIAYLGFSLSIKNVNPSVIAAALSYAEQGFQILNPNSRNPEGEFELQKIRADQFIAQERENPRSIENQVQLSDEKMLVDRMLKRLDPKGMLSLAQTREAQTHWKNLFANLDGIKKSAEVEFNDQVFRDAISHFATYLRLPEDRAGAARPWEAGVSTVQVTPQDAGTLSTPLAISILAGALETEMPFVDHKTGYPWETANYLLEFKAIAQFVGKVDQQLEVNGTCEGGWCSEEGRHPKTLLGIINKISGQT